MLQLFANVTEYQILGLIYELGIPFDVVVCEL